MAMTKRKMERSGMVQKRHKIQPAPVDLHENLVQKRPKIQPAPVDLHENLLQTVKYSGMSRIASDAGLLKNGKLKNFKHVPASSSASGARKKKAAPTIRVGRGLRHFSLKVCQKVEEKQITTYNEVADELVAEFLREKALGEPDTNYDEKNIRRRVYDALNVLMAMEIISKQKKDIRWKGLPSNIQHDMELVKVESAERLRKVEAKRQHLKEITSQYIAYDRLMKRNVSLSNPIPKALEQQSNRISLPFIAVSTASDTVIQCEMSEDRKDIFFNFSGPFEIYDETEILKRIGFITDQDPTPKKRL